LLTEGIVYLAVDTTYWIAVGTSAFGAVNQVEVSQGKLKGSNLEKLNAQTAICSNDNSIMLTCADDCRAQIVVISK